MVHPIDIALFEILLYLSSIQSNVRLWYGMKTKVGMKEFGILEKRVQRLERAAAKQ